ncbi:MAG: hypothetical protein JWQ84_2242, partial [Mucilaginibacter sp.]|nr:hypothetical protein [Mucilaginibacter sp.]
AASAERHLNPLPRPETGTDGSAHLSNHLH